MTSTLSVLVLRVLQRATCCTTCCCRLSTRSSRQWYHPDSLTSCSIIFVGLMTWRRPWMTCHWRRRQDRCVSSLMNLRKLYSVRHDERFSCDLQTLCDKLAAKISRLHLWAASCYHKDAPAGWHVEYLTRPLRFPPAVVREVQLAEDYFGADGRVLPYDERGVADHTDGQPVKRLYHRGQDHSGDRPHDCVTCGREVAGFLHSLRVPVTPTPSTTLTTITNNTAPPCLQWRDVLVLSNFGGINELSGVVTALKEANIPVRVMEEKDIEDVVTARSDVVWVGTGFFVRGLERKVVVCFDPFSISKSECVVRFSLMSRCTSQLVISCR